MKLDIRPEVTGVNLAARPNWDLPLTIAAFCDVRLDGLSTTLYGVALAWKGGRWTALPPKLPGTRPTDANAIQWNYSGPFPQMICDAMLERYAAFGGPIPDGCEHTVTAAIERVSGRREARAAYVAAKAGQTERRVFPLHSVEGKPKGEWVAGIEAELARMPLTESDDDEPEDAGGVLRTLKVEHEICDRAGL